jgi:agmatine deiminase
LSNKLKLPCHYGYKMPAEWHPHTATLMHWPSNRETWPGDRLKRVEEVYLKVLEVLTVYEPVILLCDPSAISRAEQLIKNRSIDDSQIYLIEKKINDIWARDCGPVCIKRNINGKDEFAFTDWEYNAWGEKYPPFEDDNRVPGFLAEKFNMPTYKPGIILEGGSIETNGEGLLLTTESVMLNPNRNPALDKAGLESYLHDYLGIEKVIWLKNGLAGDDTDGHIDDLARFLNKNSVLTMVSAGSEDVNHEVLQENHELLKSARDMQGNPLNIETLTLPETKIEGTTVDGSEHVPASYANFYLANDIVLVPLYDKRFDQSALGLFKRYFADRDVTGIDCTDLIWGQGSLHCITQQLYGVDLSNLKPDRMNIAD